jgi:hypothetical protein
LASRGAGAGLSPARVRHVARRQQRQRVRQIVRGKGHVIDDAGAQFVGRTAANDVQDRGVACIQPRAGKFERRARAVDQSEQLAIERDRPRHVVGEDREVVHRGDGHGIPRWRSGRTGIISSGRLASEARE